MNYSIYHELEDGTLMRDENESAQNFMEKVFKAVCCADNNDGTLMFNNLMSPEFVECDYDDMSVSFKYKATGWNSNPNGTLHGGIITTACDITMGTLARFFFNKRTVATVQLNTEYLRSGEIGKDYIVRARIIKNGRRVKFLESDVTAVEDGKMLAKASAIFM